MTSASAALVAYHQLARSCPDDFTINASISLDDQGSVGVSVGFCHLGPIAELDTLLRELRALCPVSSEITETHFVDLQRSSDSGFPEGRQHYWRSASLTNLDHEAAATLLDHAAQMPSPATGIGLQQRHGAAARVAPNATAYPHRSIRYDLLILSQWDNPADNETNIAWTNECFAAITPFADPAVYVNNLGAESETRVRHAYGVNYDRLCAVKTLYDPDNPSTTTTTSRPCTAPLASRSPRPGNPDSNSAARPRFPPGRGDGARAANHDADFQAKW